MSDYLKLIDQVINESKLLGGTPEQVAELLKARWQKPPHSTLDQWGRIKLPNGRLIYAPYPLSERWDGLTEQQIACIRAACCVDALGRWKYEKDGKTVYVPAAFSGFIDGYGHDFTVSMFPAMRYEYVKQDDGTQQLKYFGYFDEHTYRTRFSSQAEAESFIWQDK